MKSGGMDVPSHAPVQRLPPISPLANFLLTSLSTSFGTVALSAARAGLMDVPSDDIVTMLGWSSSRWPWNTSWASSPTASCSIFFFF